MVMDNEINNQKINHREKEKNKREKLSKTGKKIERTRSLNPWKSSRNKFFFYWPVIINAEGSISRKMEINLNFHNKKQKSYHMAVNIIIIIIIHDSHASFFFCITINHSIIFIWNAKKTNDFFYGLECIKSRNNK